MKKFFLLILSFLVLAPRFLFAAEFVIENKIFQFKENDAARQELNKTLLKGWNELSAKLKTDFEKYKKDCENYLKENPQCNSNLPLDWSLWGESSVGVNTPKFFSVRNDFCYFIGGGTSNCSAESFNVVFEANGTVKNLAFFEVFKESKKAELMDLIIDELQNQVDGAWDKKSLKQMGEVDFYKSIAGFVIRKDGIEIFFKKYSVGCGAAGISPVLLSHKKLSVLTFPYLHFIEKESSK